MKLAFAALMTVSLYGQLSGPFPGPGLGVQAGGGGGGCGGGVTTATVLPLTGGITHPPGSQSELSIDASNNIYVNQGTSGGSTYKAPQPGYGFTAVPSTPLSIGSAPGIAADSAGDVFVADSGNSRVVELSGGTGTALITAPLTFDQIEAVATRADGSIVYAPDNNDTNKVIAITVGVSAAFVGTSPFTLVFPIALAVDGSNNLYILDYDGVNYELYEVAGGTGSTTQIFPTPIGLSTEILAMAVNSTGTIYLADVANQQIVAVAPGGGSVVLGTCAVTLDNPVGLAVDSAGSLYVSDQFNGVVKLTF